MPKPTVTAKKKSSKQQTHCGTPSPKYRQTESRQSGMVRGKRKFVSATLPSLELRLAAIHAKNSK
ncbi:MAG TPA: hypothetical protein VK815_16470 [Candidatus Acidoferrales bacterium]|nr:hypothetical protein [Candidatus Acidoferrales bacterium]